MRSSIWICKTNKSYDGIGARVNGVQVQACANMTSAKEQLRDISSIGMYSVFKTKFLK